MLVNISATLWRTLSTAQALVLKKRAVYVTCLRDPVDRVVSMYFFGGRWPQKDVRRAEADALPLLTWLEKVGNESHKRGHRAKKHFKEQGTWPNRVRIWEEVSDYYVQMFSGIAASPATSDHYDAAKATLESFDVVLVLEALRTRPGRDTAERLLRRALPLPQTRCMPNLSAQPVNVGRVRKNEAPPSKGELKRIAALNVWDRKLYDDARRIFDDRAAEAPPTCPDPAPNCTVLADEATNVLKGENILRGCVRFANRACQQAAAPARATLLASRPVPTSVLEGGGGRARLVARPGGR